MAYGENTNSGNKKFFNFKIKTKESVDGKDVKVAPYFQVDTKVGEEYVVQPTKPKFVSGNLTRVKLGSYEYEGENIDTIQLYLEDAGEVYNVDLRFNLISRNIFNSLFNLDSFENLNFSLYENKTEKGVFPAVSIKQNDSRVDWKYKLDELPKIKKVKVGKKEAIDSSELDEFFLKHLEELVAKVDAAPKVESAPRDPETSTSDSSQVADGEELTEDIPF